jgi:hypothetical protein
MTTIIKLVVLLSICFSCHGWLILNDTQITCPGLIYPRSLQRPDIVEGLVVYDNSSDVTGKIVVAHLAFSTSVRDLQNRGAIGVIFAEFALVPGLAMFAVAGDEADIALPICQTFQENINLVLGHIVQLDPTEPNQWAVVNSSPVSIVFQVLVSAFCLTNIILAIHRSVLFVRAFGPVFGFAQVCLACEIIANTARLVYAAVDPAFMRQIFPFTVGYVLLTVSFPFTFAALCLMTFYWHEMISKTSLKINRFLGKSRVFFFVVIGLLFAIEIVTGPFRKVEYDIASTILAVGVIYGAVAVLVAVFYWATGGRVIAYLAKRSRANSDLTLIMLRRTSMRVVVSGALLLMFIGSMAFITFPAFKQPLAIILIWFLAYMFLSGTSMLQILSFYPRVMSSVGSSSVNMQRTTSSYKNQTLNSHRREGSTFQDGMASSTNDDGKIEDLVESRSSSHSSEPETADIKGQQGVSLSSNKPLATKSASEVVDKATPESDIKIIEDTSASESYSSEDERKKSISSEDKKSDSSKSEDDAGSADSQSSD